MAQTRSATATWQGDLPTGAGTVSSATSDYWRDLPHSWGSRTEEPGENTSPEELLAAAHASCFSMAVSNQLAKAGFPARAGQMSASMCPPTRWMPDGPSSQPHHLARARAGHR